MVTINKSKTVSAPLEKVWKVTSNLDEPKYWTGMRKIKVLSSTGNTVEREATVGFLNVKSRADPSARSPEINHDYDDQGPHAGKKRDRPNSSRRRHDKSGHQVGI